MSLHANCNYCVINDDNVTTGKVLDTGISATATGLLCGLDINSGKMGLWFIAEGVVDPVKAGTYFAYVKDTASKLNLYFEGGTLRIQNNLGATLYLYVKFEGF